MWLVTNRDVDCVEKRAIDSVEQLGKDDGGETDGMTKAELPLFV